MAAATAGWRRSETNNEVKQPLRGVCPRCHSKVDQEPTCTGMWSGCKAGGSFAGGGVLRTACAKCGSALVAYEDVYDDQGEVTANREFDLAKLCWSLDEAESGR
jgi:ribosomal protein L37AE/L43A